MIPTNVVSELKHTKVGFGFDGSIWRKRIKVVFELKQASEVYKSGF